MRATQGRGGEGATGRRDPEGGTAVERISGGNVFAGHDGHVYRNQGGFWQQYGSEGWNSVEREIGPSGAQQHIDRGGLSPSTRDQLNHDLAARRTGNQRISDLGYRPTGAGSAAAASLLRSCQQPSDKLDRLGRYCAGY